MRVAVGEVAIGRIEWVGPPPVDVRELSAGYEYDGTSHQVALRNLRVLDGHYRGDVRLDAREPFGLQAKLQGRVTAPLPGAPNPLPLVFEASASGLLSGFEVQARLQGEAGAVGTSATRASVTAQVSPWAEFPVASARASLQALDVSTLWPQAPRTLLTGELSLQPQGTGTWSVSADLRNALPGPWDRKRVPAERVRLQGDWRLPDQALVRELEAQVGGGRVLAQGRWEGDAAWLVEGTVTGVNPAAVHSSMAPLPLSGRATVRAQGAAIHFDTELKAAAARARAGRGNAALAATVDALELRSLQARGRWAGEELSLPLLVVRTADARLDAALDLLPRSRSGRGRADLEAPGLRVRAVGSLAATKGGGSARVTSSNLAQAQRWLRKLPGVPREVGAQLVAGRGELQLSWQGGWDDPTLQGTLSLPLLQAESGAGQGPAWLVRDATGRIDGRLADARVELRAQGQMGARDATIDLAGRGGQRSNGAWQGQVGALNLAVRDPAIARGPWRLALRRPVDLQWRAGRLEAGASEATLTAPLVRTGAASQALLSWDPVSWSQGQLRTSGRLAGLPMAWIELMGGQQLAGSALSGNLVFDAQWDALLGDTLRVRANLARSSGDVSVLAENTEGAATRVQAGVREASISLEGDGDSMALALQWDSERAGSAQGRISTRLARSASGWDWPDAAPLSGTIRAQLPRLGVWSLLAPPGWRLRGSVGADISVAGTRADPNLSGTLGADDLALRSVVDGISLQNGRLRARLDGRRLLVDEFVLQGAGPEGGRLTGTGEGSWPVEGLQVRVAAQLDRLRASSRNDRELTLSGRVAARMDRGGSEVRGELRVDRARIVLPEEAAPRLGSDVVVRNLPPGVALGAQSRTAMGSGRANVNGKLAGRPMTLAVNLDLGNDFRVQGRGITTRLTGTLLVAGESITEPRLTGVINAVGGEYRAYGQRLDIERGVLRFTGPIDNPALDILAIRPRLTQRVGVQVTGTAQAPFVRLYAEPDLPEAEKLSWLVLGRPAAEGGAETALLQQAAVALLASRTGNTGGRGAAGLLGLDELSFKREGADGPAVTLGKRLGENLYAAYERSLSGALGTLYVFYDLSRRFTLRAQAGERAALDLIFTFAYD